MTDRVVQVAGERWATYRHASELLGVPVNTLRWWVHSGRVRGETVGRLTWINLAEAEDAERARRHAEDVDAAG